MFVLVLAAGSTSLVDVILGRILLFSLLLHPMKKGLAVL